MPPRSAPRPQPSLPLRSQRAPSNAGPLRSGRGWASRASTISGSVNPFSNAIRDPRTMSSPLAWNTRSMSRPASSGQNPSQWDSNPRATMFGRPAGVSFASAPMGTSMIFTPSSRTAAGIRPAAGSAMIRLSGRSAISSAKRSALRQSRASSRSNESFMHSTGWWRIRISDAASPPRIWGPNERRIMPKHPLLPASSSNSSPAVIAPAPPDPVIATEMSQECAEFMVRAVGSACLVFAVRDARAPTCRAADP